MTSSEWKDASPAETLMLVCPWHGERYDLRSGRNVHDPTLWLDHLPIVIEQGQIWVAVG